MRVSKCTCDYVNVMFEVLTAGLLRIPVLWDVSVDVWLATFRRIVALTFLRFNRLMKNVCVVGWLTSRDVSCYSPVLLFRLQYCNRQTSLTSKLSISRGAVIIGTLLAPLLSRRMQSKNTSWLLKMKASRSYETPGTARWIQCVISQKNWILFILLIFGSMIFARCARWIFRRRFGSRYGSCLDW
jgi:hypothetical protein